MASVADRELSRRERFLSLAAVISTSFGCGISFGIGFPLTAITFENWHQAKWMAGLAGAAPAIAILIAIPFVSRLIARFGPVNAIVGGCIVNAMGFLALWAVPTPWAWIFIRLVMSAGFALPWLAAETWINAIVREELRGRVIAIYAIAYFSGYVVGPSMLQTLGLEGLLPFAVAAALTALSSLPILLGRNLAPEFNQNEANNYFSSFLLAPSAMVAAFIAGFAEISHLSLIPNVALAAGWSRDAALGLLSTMIIGGIMLQFPIGWLSDKMSRVSLVVTCGAAFIVLALLLPGALTNSAAAFVDVFLIGGVILGFYALGLAIVGERVGPGELAAANAAFIVMYQVGGLLGPIAAGIAMTGSPVIGFVASVTILMVLSGLILLACERFERSRRRGSRAPDRG